MANMHIADEARRRDEASALEGSVEEAGGEVDVEVDEDEVQSDPVLNDSSSRETAARVVQKVDKQLEHALDRTFELVEVLTSILSHNVVSTESHLRLHSHATGELGESAKVAVSMTHGLIEECMQARVDGLALIDKTKTKVERIKKQVDQIETLLTRSKII